MMNYGTIVSKMKKKAQDEGHVYEMYYDYSEKIKYIKPHRVLAMNRGEKEGILSIGIEIDTEYVLNWFDKKIIKNEKSCVADLVKDAIRDSYKRLIFPSVEREVRAELKEVAEEQAILVFGKNLEKLLLTPPMKDKIVLGFDPAYRTGCKLAVIDETGKYLDSTVVKPFLNGANQEKYIEQSKIIVKNLISSILRASAIFNAVSMLGLLLPCSISHRKLCDIPTFSASSFWLMPNCSRLSLMFTISSPFSYILLRLKRNVNINFRF